MKMKIIMAAPIFSDGEPKRFSKNCGMVAVSRWRVIMRVLLPKINHAISEPIRALPIPAHVAAIP